MACAAVITLVLLGENTSARVSLLRFQGRGTPWRLDARIQQTNGSGLRPLLSSINAFFDIFEAHRPYFHLLGRLQQEPPVRDVAVAVN